MYFVRLTIRYPKPQKIHGQKKKGKILDCRERWGVRIPIAVTLSNCVGNPDNCVTSVPLIFEVRQANRRRNHRIIEVEQYLYGLQ